MAQQKQRRKTFIEKSYFLKQRNHANAVPAQDQLNITIYEW